MHAQAEFVENKGQWDQNVMFKCEMHNGSFFAEKDAFTYVLLTESIHDFVHGDKNSIASLDKRAHAYQMKFVGAQTNSLEGLRPSEHYYNYFYGDDPNSWVSEIHPVQRVKYHEIYDGIELLLYSNSSNLKYDFLVAPGSNPSQIVLDYDGIESLEIKDGSIVIGTSVKDVIEKAPFAYQMINGKITSVECAYVLNGSSVSFDIGEYDESIELVIDPEIVFGSYVGSAASNFGFTACNDNDGNLIAGAAVFGAGYPTTLGAIEDIFDGDSGYCDAAVSKFSSDGVSLLYSTYLGGDDLEMPHSVIADSDNNYIVFGTTGSLNFPTTGGAFEEDLIGGPSFNYGTFFVSATNPNGVDFFLTKFSADGTGLLGSTFVGGTDTDGLNLGDKLFYNYGDSFRGEVIVDDNNNIYAASTTLSSDFPMMGSQPQNFNGGNHDGIVFKMNPDLTQMLWSSYQGGGGEDACYSVQLDGAGSVVVAGGTKSFDMTVGNNAYQGNFEGDVDGFLVRYSNDGGSIDAGTFIGTTNYDQCYFVQLDSDNNIYAIGQTDGDFPVNGAVYSNANSGQFIVKFDHELENLIWSTTIGTGSGQVDISPTAFLVSDCDQIYFSGWGGVTNSNWSSYASASTTVGLPLTPDAFQPNTDGSDFYLCVLAPEAEELVYASYFGGSDSNEHVDGGTSKFDKDGSVYQSVCAGCGGNDDFPTTPDAWSQLNGSTNCNLGVFKFDLGKVNAVIEIDGPDTVCEGAPVDFVNNSNGATDYEWDFGGLGSSTEFEPTYTFESNGLVQITMIATDSEGCLSPDTVSISIIVLPGVSPSVDPVEPICSGESVQLQGYGSEAAYWVDDVTLSDPTIFDPIATPIGPTSYYFVDVNECEIDTAEVFVDEAVLATTISDATLICVGESVELEATGGDFYDWTPSGFVDDPSASSVTATPPVTTTFSVVISTVEGCETTETVDITVNQNPPGGNIYPNVPLCTGYTISIEAQDGIAWSWSPAETLSDPYVQFPIAGPTVTTTYSVEITNACGTGTDQVTVEIIHPEAFAGNDGQICRGEEHPVWAEGGEEYSWTPALFVTDSDQAQTTVSPVEDQTFTVAVTDEFGCVATAEVFVGVWQLPDVDAGPDRVIDYLEDTHLFGYQEGHYFEWSPDIDIECTDCLNPLVWTDDPMWYHLTTIDDNGCRNTDSVFVDVFFPLYIPNTFTPDQDGHNDVFQAFGDNVRGFSMEIYNRWGEMIFLSDNIEKVWDGSVHDGEYYAQDGVYVWVIYFDTKDGRKRLVGHVNLIR